MRSDLLHVVTAIANPIRWQSRIALYKQFEQHMLDSGVNLTVVECAYGDRPYECAGNPHVQHIGVRAKSLVWSKENLLNIGISRLPSDAKHIATIDADIQFRKPGWASETVHALQQYDVVQPWATCYDLGPHDEHLAAHSSFCSLYHARIPMMEGLNWKPPYQYGHSGYAWAYTRQSLEWVGGLIETAALGSADHHMAWALLGKVDSTIIPACKGAYGAPLYQWEHRAIQHIGKNIGFVPGTIEHHWHGQKSKRAYVDRWQILERAKFNPVTDLKKNTYGVLELAGNKPELRHDIDLYFRQRDEDSNTLG